jgi:hypothetical protein
VSCKSCHGRGEHRSVACDHEGCYGDCGRTVPCSKCMVCCGCGERFPHAELQTLGGGGPFCEPCAERIEAEIAAL